jgi:hypothetical protein
MESAVGDCPAAAEQLGSTSKLGTGCTAASRTPAASIVLIRIGMVCSSYAAKPPRLAGHFGRSFSESTAAGDGFPIQRLEARPCSQHRK